jgi:LPXTG-motif cell wall-anchored protein
MNILRAVVTTGFCFALIGAGFAPAAKADDWNRKTVMTFSGPVEIPGVHLKGWGVLPAGTYVFKIMDSQSNRHIVQVFDKDETIIYATILAIPNYRLRETDKTVVTFQERPAGQPEALRAWFYPGDNWGEEFVYPRAKAIELAKAANTTVLYTPADLPLEVTRPILTMTEPEVVQLAQAPVMAIRPTGEDVEIAEVVTPLPAQQVTPSPALQQTADRAEPETLAVAKLPQTASSMPLIALLGLLALGGAFGLRLAQKRTL